MSIRYVGLSALLLAATAASAGPPTVPFLAPSKFVAAADETVDLRLAAGAAKDARPGAWPATPVDWMFVRGGTTQENRHEVRPAKASENSVPVPIKSAGVTLVGLDFRPTVVTMTGAELKAFIAQNIADETARAKSKDLKDDAQVRVRHVASAKTLVRTSGPRTAADRAPIATSKAGQLVEIRPMFDPTLASVDADIPVVVYIEGTKKTGVLVQATSVADGKTATFTINRGGIGDVHVTQTGVWRVETHHATQLQNDEKADWVLYSATLTFEVPATGGDQ